MTRAAVPGFLPSLHGFRFANRWPAGPTVTLARRPAHPRWTRPPARRRHGRPRAICSRRGCAAGRHDPPANGSPRFRAIVRRQVESPDWLRVPLRFYDLQAWRPDPPTRLSAILRRPPPRIVVVRDAWPLIRADIEAGRAPIVGLVRTAGCSPRRLTANHQVLAYAYEEDAGGFRIRIYDPNHPGRDDVERGRPPIRRRRAAGDKTGCSRRSRCSASSGSRTRARRALSGRGGENGAMTTIRPAVELAVRAAVAERAAALFRRAGALREGHFLLKSGRHSERYLEKSAPPGPGRHERAVRSAARRAGRAAAVDVVAGRRPADRPRVRDSPGVRSRRGGP
jgi:hypothetical protein